MKDKFNKIKDWISSIDKTKVKDWFIKFNKSQLNWIRLGVIGIWIITLININQFLNNKNSGAIPVYVEGGRIGVTVFVI